MKHGMHKTVEYRAWRSMKDRCYNKNGSRYHRYGGRGIVVCERWLDSFENFYKDMGNRPEGTSLDRVNNDGNYSSENCRWATPRQQYLNRSFPKLSKTGMRGITKRYHRWRAEVRFAGKSYLVGSYETPEEAVVARENYLTKLEVKL